MARSELLTDVAAALKALRECPKDLRGWEWHYLMRRCLEEPLVIRDTTQVLGVAFSFDGDQLASAGGDGTIKIWHSRTGRLVREIPNAHAKAAGCVVFHPDRKHLASAGADGRVKVWDLTVEPAVCVFEGPCDALRKFGVGYTVAFSPPDGRLLAAGSGGVVRVWDWMKNRPQHPEYAFPGHKNHSIPVAFSDDGRRLATGSASQGQRIWDPESGLQIGAWPAPSIPGQRAGVQPGRPAVGHRQPRPHREALGRRQRQTPSRIRAYRKRAGRRLQPGRQTPGFDRRGQDRARLGCIDFPGGAGPPRTQR